MEQGKCNCGSENITYGISYPDNDNYLYEFTCDDCGKEGKEYYFMEYIETITE